MVMLFLVVMSEAAVGQSGSTIDVLSPEKAFSAETQSSFVVAELAAPQTYADSALVATKADANHGVSDAAESPLPALFSPEQLTPSLRTVVLIGVLSLVPAVLVMSTCFARMAIVFGLLRHGLGAQQWLPNQIVLALSLFLTYFVMAPVWTRSYEDGIKPYVNGSYETSAQQQAAFDAALERAVGPLRHFMSTQIAATGNEAAIDMLMSYAPQHAGDSRVPQYFEDVPLRVLLPAYLLSELKTAFVLGIQIVLPFLVIDFVVASVLTGMGLVMMSPVLVSLPFKLLLFVLIDGWTLTVDMLLRSLSVT